MAFSAFLISLMTVAWKGGHLRGKESAFDASLRNPHLRVLLPRCYVHVVRRKGRGAGFV